jgi:hypothetical protein
MFKINIWTILLLSVVCIYCQQVCIGNSVTQKAVCFHSDPSNDQVLEGIAQALTVNQALFIPTNQEIENMGYHVAKVEGVQDSKMVYTF